MKKIISISAIFFCLLAGTLFIIFTPAQASATAKTTTTKATNSKTTKPAAKAATKLAPVKWASSGLRAVAKVPSGVRPAYKKKVENYARRNKIKLITAAVVNAMRE